MEQATGEIVSMSLFEKFIILVVLLTFISLIVWAGWGIYSQAVWNGNMQAKCNSVGGVWLQGGCYTHKAIE